MGVRLGTNKFLLEFSVLEFSGAFPFEHLVRILMDRNIFRWWLAGVSGTLLISIHCRRPVTHLGSFLRDFQGDYEDVFPL